MLPPKKSAQEKEMSLYENLMQSLKDGTFMKLAEAAIKEDHELLKELAKK